MPPVSLERGRFAAPFAVTTAGAAIVLLDPADGC
jgi:hypothetical protein